MLHIKFRCTICRLVHQASLRCADLFCLPCVCVFYTIFQVLSICLILLIILGVDSCSVYITHVFYLSSLKLVSIALPVRKIVDTLAMLSLQTKVI